MSDSTETNTATEPRRKVGDILRDERILRDEDLKDVAKALAIRLPFMEAIEKSEPQNLPGAAYALGFVRSYADYLGLDSRELVEQYKEEAKELEREIALNFPEPLPSRGVPVVALLFIGTVLAILFYGAWWYLNNQGKEISDYVPSLSAEQSETVDAAPVVEETTTALVEETVTEQVEEAVEEVTEEVVETAATVAEEVTEVATEAVTEVEETVTEAVEAATEEAAEEATAPVAEETTEVVAETVEETVTEVAEEVETEAAPAVTEEVSEAEETVTETVVEQVEEVAEEATTETVEEATEEVTEAATTETTETSQPEVPVVAVAEREPRIYGEENEGSRVTLLATDSAWVEVSNSDGELTLTRLLRKGDRYLVPNESGLTMVTGNAGGISIVVDGKELGPSGPVGAVRRGYLLDAETLLATGGE